MLSQENFHTASGLKPEDIAILVIDMQTSMAGDFLDGKYTQPPFSKRNENEMWLQREAMLRLLDWSSANKIKPVFAWFFRKDALLSDILQMYGDGLMMYNRDMRFFDQATAYRYTKMGNDAFGTPYEGQEDLDTMLRFQGKKGIIIAGVNASACVLETAETASSLGYHVLTAPELLTDGIKNAEKHRSLANYARIAHLLPDLDSILGLLSGEMSEESYSAIPGSFWKQVYIDSFPIEYKCGNCSRDNFFYSKNGVPYIGKPVIFGKKKYFETYAECSYCGTGNKMLMQHVSRDFFQAFLRTWQRQDQV